MTGLYVHVPFCRAKCRYCDFASVPVGENDDATAAAADAYLEALTSECAARAVGFPAFDTVYVGGGTPGILGAAHIGKLFAALRGRLEISASAEITFELNPESVTAGKLATLKNSGVNRLSFGAQSFDDEILGYLGRVHRAVDTKDKFELARSAGFDNIGLDLIFGVPFGAAPGRDVGNSAAERWAGDLETAAAMKPEHISVYALSVENGTPLAAAGVEVSDDEQAEQYEIARQFLVSAGYVHYEISNFALPGKESRHNINYWRGGEYLGVGPSAASFRAGARRKNTESLDEYLESGGTAVSESERLDVSAARAEKIFLGLRLVGEGVRLDDETLRLKSGAIKRLESEGLAVLDGDTLKLTGRSLFLSNAVMREFV